MVRNTIPLLAALVGVSRPAPSGQAGDDSLAVRAVRFYRAEHERTHIKGLVEIPIAPAPGAATASTMSYTVSVRVTDSTGLTLHHQSWRGHAPLPSGGTTGSEVFTVEIVDFAIAPGRYKLEVAVADSLSGHNTATTIELKALTHDDPVSDLLIAPEIRAVAPGDTIPRPGEFRAGNNLVTAVARLRLTPLRSKVFYLLEAYSDSGTTGTMHVAVQDSTGRTIVGTPETPVTVAAGGSMVKGQVDLAGLPEGSYRILTAMTLGGRTVERSAPLTMAGLQETLARDSVRREIDRVTDAGYFAAMKEKELDEAEAPLLYIGESAELSRWSDDLSVAAKRRFLTTFWQRRDPTPGTANNEARERFYAAIAYANRAYREGGRAAVPGWRSDRGRIYARNRAPDDVLRRQQEGRAPPYEVWSYSKGKGLFYIFADRTGVGNYVMIHSNDLKESGLPGWGDILGVPAISDISQFLGQDLLKGGRVY